MELEALNDSFDEINRMRAGLIAISPQKPSINYAVKRKLGVKYEVFSDVGLTLSESLGLVFELPLRLQKVYAALGVDLQRANADGLWRLPMPARLIVDRSRRTLDAEVNVDYLIRLEPSETIKKLELIIIRNR